MTKQQSHHDHDEEEGVVSPPSSTGKVGVRKRWWTTRSLWVLGVILISVFILLFVIALVSALTVFKVKQPKMQLLSAVVEGVAPQLTLPAFRIQLNLTLKLRVGVENRNYASFRHGVGESGLLYRGLQVGEAEIEPGLVPSRGSTTLPCRLTLQVERLLSASHHDDIIISLIRDVMSGQVVVEARSRLPGKISFLRVYKKHVLALSDCQLTLTFPGLNIRHQDCHFKTKF